MKTSDQRYPFATEDPPRSAIHTVHCNSPPLSPTLGDASSQMGEETGSRLSTTLDGMRYAVREPSWKELRRVAFVSGVPFVGFGMMDNAIMIIVSFMLNLLWTAVRCNTRKQFPGGKLPSPPYIFLRWIGYSLVGKYLFFEFVAKSCPCGSPIF